MASDQQNERNDAAYFIHLTICRVIKGVGGSEVHLEQQPSALVGSSLAISTAGRSSYAAADA